MSTVNPTLSERNPVPTSRLGIDRARTDAPPPPIRAAVVLAGVAGRLAQVRSALGRNLFDLPRTPTQGLLDEWLERFDNIAKAADGTFTILVAVDRDAPEPRVSRAGRNSAVNIVRDADATRGTAGILRDLTRELDDDAHVLVIPASDLAWQWSSAEADAIFSRPEGVVLSVDRNLRPAGPMRVRCGLLKRVPSVGFVDLKEQFLPRCRGAADVFISRSERSVRGSLHDLRSYLSLVGNDGPDDVSDLMASAEPWQPGRALVEQGASVHAGAILFDSVVLQGARVEAGAVIVRSVIGPGAVVGMGVEVVDRVLVGGGKSGRNREVDW